VEKIQVGYLIDDGDQPWNVVDLVQNSLHSEEYTISHLIVQKVINKNDKSRFKKVARLLGKYGIWKLMNRILFKLIFLFEYYLILRNPNLKKIYLKSPLESMGIPKVYVDVIVSESGLIHSFGKDAIEKIKSLGLDLLIRGGSGILRGEILSVCEHGIISFHHGDIEINRGGPSGFWEVLEQEATTGFTIQKLTEELDNGEILFKGKIPTSTFYTKNKAILYIKANIFMHTYLNNFREKKYLTKPRKSIVYDRKLYKIPNNRTIFKYIYKNALILIKKLFKKLTRNRNDWSVSYQLVTKWEEVSLRKCKRIMNPRNSFYADPFVIQHQDRNICFFEEYEKIEKKGKISAIEIYNQEEYRKLGQVLEENFHLSYPYVFKVNNEIYMCPESSKSQDIRLYKCIEFPMKWELHKIIMNNISAVDTNIFYHKNTWWLFTNIDSANIGEHNSELHIFYADDFDSSNWKPHKLNPVIFDSTKSRNGGVIFEKDKLYRVYQSHGFDQYGKSIGINQITLLSQSFYEEINIKKVEPKFFDGQTRVHTFSVQNKILVLDTYGKMEKN